VKFQHGQRLDTFETLEALGPGDRVTIAGKPATVFDVVEGDEVYIVYVLDGRKTKKELSMFDAVLPSETEEDEEYDDYDDFGEPDPNFVEKPEVEVRYIAPGKDLFDEPGLRKSPGRRNRPMTSIVPRIAEGKTTMKITKNQLRRIIREEISKKDILSEGAKIDMIVKALGKFKDQALPALKAFFKKNPELIEDAISALTSMAKK
jgi:preprotein translocase subunit YajC